MRVEIDPTSFADTSARLTKLARSGGADLREVKKVWGLVGRKGKVLAGREAIALGIQRARGGKAGFQKLSKPSAYTSRVRTYRNAGRHNIEVSLRAGSDTAEGKQVSRYAHFPHFGVGRNSRYGRPEWVYKALNRSYRENQKQLTEAYEKGVGRQGRLT